jgi:hypothetical protein
MERVQYRAKQGHGPEADGEPSQHHQHKAAASNVPRCPHRTGADVARDHGTHSDGQTDQRRGLEKADYARESNCRGDRLLAKKGDVEEI